MVSGSFLTTRFDAGEVFEVSKKLASGLFNTLQILKQC